MTKQTIELYRSNARQSAEIISRRGRPAPGHAIIVGTGLAGITNVCEDVEIIPYAQLPGFPQPSVDSHKGEVILGRIAGAEVIILSGRKHYYETNDARLMRVPIETLSILGCPVLIQTCSTGSMRHDMKPGSLMIVRDHIYLGSSNPLMGETGNNRFVNMTQAYDRALRHTLQRICGENDISAVQGVYMWFCGSAFETPAEISLARFVRADAVGMSLVHETILARYFGLKVAALAFVSNLAAGIDTLGEADKEFITHELTMERAGGAIQELCTLLRGYFETCAARQG